MSLPYVITILVTDGDPDGVRVVEKSNWTGRGLVFARSDLATAFGHGISSPGIYVLVGDDPDEEFDQQIYIGQGEDVGKRLRQHQGDDNKEFWNETVVFVSGNESLNRAHISHLESSLIQLASAAKRARVANVNQPAIPRMAQIDTAIADGFLAEVLAIFPVLGIDSFDLPETKPSGRLPETKPSGRLPETKPSGRHRYFLTGPSAKGEGEERSDGFVIFAGAKARRDEAASIGKSSQRVRARLVASESLVVDGENYRLAEDTLFNSPSTAAKVLLGREANGRIEWKDANGVTLKQHQIQQAANAEGQA